MGVDYSPMLIVGWEITDAELKKIAPPLSEDYYDSEIAERAAEILGYPIRETGARCYGGESGWWISLLGSQDDMYSKRAGPTTIAQIAALAPAVEKVRAKALEFGITLSEDPVVCAELLVW